MPDCVFYSLFCEIGRALADVAIAFGAERAKRATDGSSGNVLAQLDIAIAQVAAARTALDRKSTRLNSSHLVISYAVFCLKKKKPLAVPSRTHFLGEASAASFRPRREDARRHRRRLVLAG